MMTRLVLVGLLLGAGACGGGGPAVAPVPLADSALDRAIDSLWTSGLVAFRTGDWAEATSRFERVVLEFRPGDSRIPLTRFHLGEAYFARGSHFEAAREFRRVADQYPNHELAPRALLRTGEVWADLWRRPELDPTYGETARAAFVELRNRFPASRAAVLGALRIAELDARFAEKAYLNGLYYHRLKAYDSAILYFRDVVATYPRTPAAPKSLLKLLEAYRALRYAEDVTETCGYIARFHPELEAAREFCPAAVG